MVWCAKIAITRTVHSKTFVVVLHYNTLRWLHYRVRTHIFWLKDFISCDTDWWRGSTVNVSEGITCCWWQGLLFLLSDYNCPFKLVRQIFTGGV